jgi:hypothetical protein
MKERDRKGRNTERRRKGDRMEKEIWPKRERIQKERGRG